MRAELQRVRRVTVQMKGKNEIGSLKTIRKRSRKASGTAPGHDPSGINEANRKGDEP